MQKYNYERTEGKNFKNFLYKGIHDNKSNVSCNETEPFLNIKKVF